MKKNLLKISTFALVLTLTSCSQDIGSSVDTSEIASINANTLKVTLQNFNKDFKYSSINNSNVNSKKWWQYVGQACAIVAGDAAGAAGTMVATHHLALAVGMASEGTGYVVVQTVSGVVGGVGGSYAAYCGTGGHCRVAFNGSTENGFPVKYDFPSEYDYIENFGDLHNQDLNSTHMSENTMSEIDWIGQNVPNINSIDYNKLYNSEEFRNLCNKINEISTNYKNSNYDYEQMLNDYKNSNLISDETYDILNLYFAATLKAQNFEEYKAITDYYVQQIIDANLGQDDKRALFACFSVSIQSAYYWLNAEEV